jgi:cytochrome c oxidase subunit 2
MPTFSPGSHQAHIITALFVFVLILSAVVLAGVAGAVLFAAWRFRRKSDDSDEIRQVHGQRLIEIVWTSIPIAIVALLFGLTIVAMRRSDPDAPADRAPDIVLVAHQWWWEIRYPAAHVITANDLRIPAGTPQLVELDAADVIHDFWVPRLSRKIDMIPGHPVRLWLTGDSVGTYSGACAEYCGTEHAWMRLRVTAAPPDSFAQWLAAQQQPAATPPDSTSAGATLFAQRTCVNCHAVRGTNDAARIGPDLTHLASRPALAAERLPNTPENLRRWIAEPDVIKPGSYMPNLHLRAADLDRLVAYLETLR